MHQAPLWGPLQSDPSAPLRFCCGCCSRLAPVSPEKPIFSFFPLRYNHHSFKNLCITKGAEITSDVCSGVFKDILKWENTKRLSTWLGKKLWKIKQKLFSMLSCYTHTTPMGLQQQRYSKRQNWKMANVPVLKHVNYFFLLGCPECISLEGQCRI